MHLIEMIWWGNVALQEEKHKHCTYLDEGRLQELRQRKRACSNDICNGQFAVKVSYIFTCVSSIMKYIMSSKQTSVVVFHIRKKLLLIT